MESGAQSVSGAWSFEWRYVLKTSRDTEFCAKGMRRSRETWNSEGTVCKGREGHRMEGVQKPKGIGNSEWTECKRSRGTRNSEWMAWSPAWADRNWCKVEVPEAFAGIGREKRSQEPG